MTYRLRLEHAETHEWNTIVVKCKSISAVMARLAAAGWIVVIYYEL